MSPREWFVLGIRLFGLWLLTRGVTYLSGFVDLRLGLGVPLRGTNANGFLFYAACDFALAAHFLFGARHLARICEGADKSDERGQDNEEVE